MSLSPALKQRIVASLADVPAPTRAETRRARAGLFGCGLMGAMIIFLAQGGAPLTSRPLSLVALTSLGTTTAAGAGMWLLFTRGRSVLGRRASRLAAIAIVSALVFIAWRYGISFIFGQTGRWPERPGFRCLDLGVATGVLPLMGALLSWRRTIVLSPVTTGAAFGAGAGLGSSFLVDLWCPVSYLPHLLLGHLLPIALLALFGGIVGARLLAIRWRPLRSIAPASARSDG